MYNSEWDLLLMQLNQMFNGTVMIQYIQACSDDDSESGYAVVYDGVILGNPELGFLHNAQCIYEYLLNKLK